MPRHLHSTSLVLALLAPNGLAVQAVPTLRIDRDLRIDAAAEDLSPIGWLTVSPSGTIVVSQSQDGAIRFFDTRGKALGSFGRSGEGPGEFGTLAQRGWLAETLWVHDPSTARTTFISPARTLLRSVVQRAAVTVPGVPQDSMPHFILVVPRARYRNGDLLIQTVEGAGPRPPWATGAPGTWYVLKTNAEGVLLGVFSSRPPNECSIQYSYPRGSGSVGTPYCGAPLEDLAADGTRYVVATVERQAAPRTAYRVTVVRGPGDTVFTSIFERDSEAIPRRFADSLMADRRARATMPAQAAAYDRVRMPSVYPPIASILLGQDDTIWIEEFTPIYRRDARPWLVLDGRGAPVGRVRVPGSVRILAASRTAIWGTDTDDDGLQHIVRYRVSR